ncbi:uncharacterized protein LOC143297944 [Babylonia areolata]|uniref:uncharacterized protein LOC143297944 n=1 Tax=Babylonia areolata TaxID=304850 RepID=UPI003FD0D3C6
MVERAPKYRATFKAMPKVGVLGSSMAPYTNADVTNPRELYALLSGSRHGQQDALLTSVKLPPLESSSEMPQFPSLGSHRQHGSHPDLASWRSEKDERSDPVVAATVRRSSSLQDLHSLDLSARDSQGKKLKPILRVSNAKNAGEHGNNGKSAVVKFGEKEVHLIRDSPLPPIDGVVRGKEPGGVRGAVSPFSGAACEGPSVQGEKSSRWISSPRHQRRFYGAEFSPDVFPRGQPVEVKKPATPTYKDYPQAYWELRSATVQDPSDLKDDMIDRDRYRLQQISSLRLKAMNRELAASKLDSYRKWQQQMLATSPTVPGGGVSAKQDSARGSVTPSITGPGLSARAGKQQKLSVEVPVHNDDHLAVAATSISPSLNPLIKKRMESSSKVVGSSPHGTSANSCVTEDEFRRRQKIEAVAKGELNHEPEGKPVRATVVNLCIEPDRSSNSTTSEVYTGIRRITVGPRPLSDMAGRTQHSLHDQEQPSQAHVPRPPGSVSVASVNATLGSSQSHRFARVLSAPAESLADGSAVMGEDLTDSDSSVSSKKILKKFTKLQVFSEKYPPPGDQTSGQPWDVVSVKPTEKGPYLPQSRPPTYKLDLKAYPTRHHSFMGRGGGGGEELGVIAEGGDGHPFFASERGLMPPPHLRNSSPSRSPTPSLSFHFSNGEVIVSRQSKKSELT